MFPPCLRGELEKQRTAVFLPFTPVAASAARGEAEISCHIFVAKQKYPTPDEKSGVRYEQTYSTVPPCLRSQRSAARVLCNGRSRPSLHIGGRLQGGSRFRLGQKPLAAYGGFSLLSSPDGVLFHAFFQIRGHYITLVFLCQGDKPRFEMQLLSRPICAAFQDCIRLPRKVIGRRHGPEPCCPAHSAGHRISPATGV